MQEAYERTRKSSKKAALRGKRNYDSEVKSSELEEGDCVLVRNMTPRGELRRHWEVFIYNVVCQVNRDLPIYEVMPEQWKGRDSRILQRNLLLPCNHLLLDIPLKIAAKGKKY